VTGPVLNWATAWPRETQQAIGQRYGYLGPESTASERNRFIWHTMQDYLLPEHRPDVLVLWITEPDHAQHAHGLGSPEAIAALAELDKQLERFVQSLQRSSNGEEHSYLLLSDHGFSTISRRIDVNRRLVEAGIKASPDSRDIVYDCNSFYLTGAMRDRLGEVVRFLAGEPWIGALLVRDDLLKACPGAMPQSAVFGTHRRSSELMFTYQWWSEENDYGVTGLTASSSASVATHGSASPYDLNNSLVAWGKGIKRETVSRVPCGMVDIAPTVLHLLGIESPATMEGRVLGEILQGGPSPETIEVSQIRRESIYATANGPRHQVAWYSQVNAPVLESSKGPGLSPSKEPVLSPPKVHRYLDQITFNT
jgi:predicted AlkP superfamily pyrophosphatase or phosphodiesterase